MLDAKEHSRIIADFEGVCSKAGIQGHFLYESMKKFCGDKEVDWVTHFWKHKAAGLPGIVLNGVQNPSTRCQAIAAALVRNYIDARVVLTNTLVDALVEGSIPSPTVLLIPNLYVAAMCKTIPPFKVQALYDVLLDRSIKGKPSVVYVEDLKGLVGVFGTPFRDFLNGFRVITD